MTDTIQQFIEILERHIRVIQNEREPLQVECASDGDKVVMARLVEAFTTDLQNAGLIERPDEPYNCEEEGHEIDTDRLGTPFISDSGQTVEINGYCMYCGIEVRDVYLHSLLMDGHGK